MTNSIKADLRTSATRRKSPSTARDFPVAVAMANRLSALLTEDAAR
jgi:hypothetical protein